MKSDDIEDMQAQARKKLGAEGKTDGNSASKIINKERRRIMKTVYISKPRWGSGSNWRCQKVWFR
jgi:hypothetical protein